MENTIDPSELSVVILKKWLLMLEQPTKGSKAELVARINAIPPEQRGVCPDSDQLQVCRDKIQSGEIDEDIQYLACEKTLQQLQEEINESRTLLESLKLEIETKAMYIQQRTPTQSNTVIMKGAQADDISCTQTQNIETNSASVSKNNNFDEQLMQNQQHAKGSDDVSSFAGNVTTITQRHNQEAEEQLKYNGPPTTSLAFAKDVAMEYRGESCANAWVVQLKNIATIYDLNDQCLRTLFISKLKGRAQTWLHAHPTRMLQSVNKLFEEFILAFGEKISKTEMRRAFENRKWQRGENFAKYFEEKTMMAQNINIDPDELLEQIIEGIPSESLKTQARIQCFTDTMQILRAFAKVNLTSVDTPSDYKSKASGENTLRCLNCNARGHFARDCKKPKREPGSCYACGNFGHFVAMCPEKKSANNNFVRFFKIFFVNSNKLPMISECLIDTGSPISFVKRSFISTEVA